MPNHRNARTRAIRSTSIFRRQDPEIETMAKKIYDVIVIGTGAGGGMAIKTLCEAGLKVCALNAGRQADPRKDFRQHRMPYDLKFRGFDSPERRAISIGYMDNEYVAPDAWEHEIAYSTA